MELFCDKIMKENGGKIKVVIVNMMNLIIYCEKVFYF